MNAEAKQVEDMNWPEVIESAREKFLEIQPQGMNFTAERAFAIQHLKNNDYLMKVAKANPASLQAAMLNVAAVGLSLNPAKKQAYLVPRNGRVCFDPGFQGLCDMATDSGAVKWVQVRSVYESEEFIDTGLDQRPIHNHKPFAKKAERGPFAGAYCCVKTAGDDYLTTVMTFEEIEAIRMKSELGKKNQGPWADSYEEMAKKTVIRRAFKMWPKTKSLDRMALAVQLSNENEEFAPIVTSPELRDYSPQQKEYFDDMLTKNDALGMFVFQHTIEETVFNNLFHSFERGKKGKYQQVIRDLLQKGGAMIRDIVEAVNEAAGSDNDYGVRENVEGLSKEAVQMILDQCSAEAAAMIRDLDKAA